MPLTWRRVADLVFPTITPFDQETLRLIEERREATLAAIVSNDWNEEAQVALEQAIRIAEEEDDRKKTAESKGTTYLTVTSALIPVILTIQGTLWQNQVGPAPEWVRILVTAVAILYTAMAGRYAFATLDVANYHKVGAPDVVDAWKAPTPVIELVRSTLTAVVRSQETVNAKVTTIRLTHLHLIRAFVAFVVLLLIDPAFLVGGEIFRLLGW